MAGEKSALALALPLVLLAAAAAAALSFLPKPAPAGQQGWELSLELVGRPFVSGNNATLHAFSTCGPVEIFLDGEKIGACESYASLPVRLQAGSHTLIAKGGGCTSSLQFEVLARECEGSQTSSCEVDGCEGARRCAGGIYSPCSLPRKVCVPGERMGCSTDGCKFGYAACNACGTGFGECLPPENWGMKNFSRNSTTMKNSSAQCSGSGCG